KRIYFRFAWLFFAVRRAADLDHLDIAGAANIGNRRGRDLVGDEDVDVVEMSDTDRSGPRELHPVGHEDDLAGIVDDRPRHAYFARVEIEQRSVLFERRSAYDRKVDLELRHKINGGGPDHGSIRPAHRPARHDHLDAGLPIQ